MTPSCPTCGQALPDQPRRDPPLAPLEQPNVVTIHDLPEGERERAGIVRTYSNKGVPIYRLSLPRDVVDGREGGG